MRTAGTDSSAADGRGGAGDNETERTFIHPDLPARDAFLFGRRTYELFAGSWGAIEEMRATHRRGVE